MALAKLAEEAQTNTGCAVCRELRRIPQAEADGLRALLANTGLRYTEISDMIAADPDTPLDLSGDTLGKHARGGCSAREKLR